MIISVPDPWGTLLHKALAKGSRSTVLNPLAWFITICATAGITSFRLRLPSWVGTMFIIYAAIGALLYLIFYGYYSFTGKEDCLRSERFSIQKMAIKAGFVGDDSTGFIRLSDSKKSLPSAQEQEENK